MKNFKSSFYGYKKKSVRDHLDQLLAEHGSKKQSLEREYNDIQNEINELKESLRLRREGGHDS